jgi:hypothetical protein
MQIMGLQNFNLTKASLRQLGSRHTLAHVYLRTYDVTPTLRRMPPEHRLAYVANRVDRWIKELCRAHSRLSFQVVGGSPSKGPVRQWSQLPSTLVAQGAVRDVLRLIQAAGISSVYITKVAGVTRSTSRKPRLRWYCVRALVIIRVERFRTGMQTVEDRFVLVRALSVADAQKRLRRQWRAYAAPYFNSEGRMVSWSFGKVIDVYDVGESEIDSDGTEVYSKLSKRRMRGLRLLTRSAGQTRRGH